MISEFVLTESMTAGRDVDSRHSETKFSENAVRGGFDLCSAHREKQPMAEQT